jgi:hypothetical protein
VFRNRGFESRAFPTRFVLTRPQQGGRRLKTAVAFIAGSVCVLALSKVDPARLSEWAVAATPDFGALVQETVALASDKSRRSTAAERTRAPDAGASARATVTPITEGVASVRETQGARVAVHSIPPTVEQDAGAIPLPTPRPDIATTAAGADSELEDARDAFAAAQPGADVQSATNSAAEAEKKQPRARPRHSKKRRDVIVEGGETYVHAYDYVLPDGRREPVYRRARRTDRADHDGFFPFSRRGLAPFEHRGIFSLFD